MTHCLPKKYYGKYNVAMERGQHNRPEHMSKMLVENVVSETRAIVVNT